MMKNNDNIYDVIKAKHFELIDDSGSILCRIEATGNGDGFISTFNKGGDIISKIGTSDDGEGYLQLNNNGAIYLATKDNKVAALLKADDNCGFLKLLNNNNLRINLNNDDKGNAFMALYNKDGKVSIILSSRGDDDKDGQLYLFNKEGNIIAGIGYSSEGNGVLAIKNNKGDLVDLIAANNFGGGYIATYSNGKATNKITADEKGCGTLEIYANEIIKSLNKTDKIEFIKKLTSYIFPLTFFIAGIIFAFLAYEHASSYNLAKYSGSLINALGIISASCFISSALLLIPSCHLTSNIKIRKICHRTKSCRISGEII